MRKIYKGNYSFFVVNALAEKDLFWKCLMFAFHNSYLLVLFFDCWLGFLGNGMLLSFDDNDNVRLVMTCNVGLPDKLFSVILK